MENLNWIEIVSLLLLIVSTVFIGAWMTAKNKARQIYNLGKEAIDVAKAAIDALDDNKITKEEVELIKKEAQEVAAAWRILRAKTE